MLNRLFGSRAHDALHFFCLSLIAIGLPSTKVLMSIGMVLMLINLLLEADFHRYLKAIKNNRILHVLIAFFILHLVGLIWTSDFPAGLQDVKRKLPLLMIPLLMVAKPLQDQKSIQRILQLFIASLLLTSLYNWLSFNHIIGSHVYDDIRGLSLFASHIRYGMLICIGIAVCIYLYLSQKKWMLGYGILILWFCYYTIYSQILSAYLSFGVLLIAIVFVLLWRWKKWAALAFTSIPLTLLILTISFFLPNDHKEVDVSKLPYTTELGNVYYHSTESLSEVNNQYVFLYYCEIELDSAWSNRSQYPFMGKDDNHHLLRATLARYMTSRNLTKDAKGVAQLTNQDIQNIEHGYTSYQAFKHPLLSRFYGIKYQLLNATSPNGHSPLQRFVYWKTSIYIIQNGNWLIGEGTGGSQKAFDHAYTEIDTGLLPELRHRSHNLFLSYMISHGVIGLFLLITLIMIILIHFIKKKQLLPLLFSLIYFLSFLTEDTIETQLGVTIFGFFIGMFIQESWNSNVNKPISNSGG